MGPRIIIPLAGLFLIGGSVLLRSQGGRPIAPGRLVPETARATWDCPPPHSIALAESRTSVAFSLRNLGGTPIRILSLTSGCGCAEPKAEPKVVPVGGSCRVTVAASPLQFGVKTVPIRVVTDSSSTPVIELELRIRGSQKPPFLQSTSGDLVFSEPKPGQTREFGVVSVVPIDVEEEPRVVCDLPYVQVNLARRDSRPEGTVPGFDVRIDWFTVTLDEGVPGDFRGEVRVLDPWVEGRILPLDVSGTTTPSVRVAPARLTLRIREAADSGPPTMFMVAVRDRELASRVTVTREEGAPPLVIERGEPQGGGLWIPIACGWNRALRSRLGNTDCSPHPDQITKVYGCRSV